jgi:hypothetical protein
MAPDFFISHNITPLDALPDCNSFGPVTYIYRFILPLIEFDNRLILNNRLQSFSDGGEIYFAPVVIISSVNCIIIEGKPS